MSRPSLSQPSEFRYFEQAPPSDKRRGDLGHAAMLLWPSASGRADKQSAQYDTRANPRPSVFRTRRGSVRFGSVPHPVPAGSRIERFGSVRFGRLGSVSYTFGRRDLIMIMTMMIKITT